MKILVFDCETRDPYISLKLGAGWAYKLHVPTSTFVVLGYAYASLDTETGTLSKPDYLAINDNNLSLLTTLLKEHDHVLMHNAPYDLGCLLTLGIDIGTLSVLDTRVIGVLYDNNLMSYSLESLSMKYLGQDQFKDKEILYDAAVRLDKHAVNLNTITAKKRVIDWAYKNMDVIHNEDFESMRDYATQDIVSTAGLLMYYFKAMKSLDPMLKWCKYQVYLTQMRGRGVRIDMQALNTSIEKLRPAADKMAEDLKKDIGIEDLNSPQQLGNALKEKGYRLPPNKIGYSTDKDTLLRYVDDPLIKRFLEWRELDKTIRDFLEKMRDMQMYSCPEALEPGAKYGRVFPEFNLFGAQRTGRFSCANINMQQIPARSEYADLCRAIFVPNKEGNQWIAADLSNQEGRLQIHYANAVKSPGADTITKAFFENPKLDLHQKVADLTGLSRQHAKALNLGLAYGMGSAKLSRSCGLGTEWVTTKYGKEIEVADKNGMYILEQYHKGAPYLKHLSEEAMKRIRFKGFIKTLGGRVLRREEERFDYKALNKLIQGSAADQILKIYELCVQSGITVIALVHDEICIEGTEEDAKKLKHLMETAIEFSIPMIAEVEMGSSWGTVEKLSI